jgi:hypothetical protein
MRWSVDSVKAVIGNKSERNTGDTVPDRCVHVVHVLFRIACVLPSTFLSYGA